MELSRKTLPSLSNIFSIPSVSLGLSKLGVDAVSYDFPASANHGFSNRVLPLARKHGHFSNLNLVFMPIYLVLLKPFKLIRVGMCALRMAYLASRLKDNVDCGVTELECQAVLAWSGHEFGLSLDRAGMFVSEIEVSKIIDLGMLFLQAFTRLASEKCPWPPDIRGDPKRTVCTARRFADSRPEAVCRRGSTRVGTVRTTSVESVPSENKLVTRRLSASGCSRER